MKKVVLLVLFSNLVSLSTFAVHSKPTTQEEKIKLVQQLINNHRGAVEYARMTVRPQVNSKSMKTTAQKNQEILHQAETALAIAYTILGSTFDWSLKNLCAFGFLTQEQCTVLQGDEKLVTELTKYITQLTKGGSIFNF